ncbi:MAG: hypothetical protein ACR2GY_06585 [Phycisphaerales bacterium]
MHFLIATIVSSATALTPPSLDLVPGGASAALVIPHVKRASDEITQCMQGRDRAQLLLGARPADQLRALLGLQSGVDEAGAAAVIFMTPDLQADPIYLVPVSNAADFLEANFDPAPDGPSNALVHSSGETMFAKELDRHVAFSRSPGLIETFAPTPGLAAMLTARMGERASTVMARSEAILYLSNDMLDQIAERSVQRAQAEAAMGGVAEMGAMLSPELLHAADAAIVTFNFDPLGLGVGGFLALNPGTQAGKLAKGGRNGSEAMSRLPGVPYFFAASIDINGLGGPEVLRLLAGEGADIPEWLNNVTGVQCAMSPSVLGIQGGLFNETVLYLETSDATSAQTFLKDQLLAIALQGDGVTASPDWKDDVRVIEGVSVSTYEVATTFPPDDATSQMIQAILFGRRGLNGFAGQTDGGVVITFSQRPDVFTRAVNAARGEDTLNHNVIITQMRNWLPPSSDIEIFIGIGQIGKLMNQLAGAFPIIPADALPRIDADTRPIGMGLEVSDGILEGGMVIPADVLTLVLDGVMQQISAEFGGIE